MRRFIRGSLHGLLIAAVLMSSLALASVRTRADEGDVADLESLPSAAPAIGWPDVTPVARYRNQADWMVDMGQLSEEEAYGPFPTHPYEQGDTEEFYALDFLSNRKDARVLTATLKLVTEHAYWWFEKGTTVDQDKLEAAGKRFENDIYPLNTRLYGHEWLPGIDGDPRLFILHQKKIGGYAVGVFSLRDECPADLCPDSNQRELLYIGLDFAPVGSAQQLSVISHEFQHLIQYNNDGNEQRWLNEGLSQLAEHLNGFNPRDIGGNAVRGYLADANFQVNSWPASAAKDPSINYGVSYLFCLYLYQRFGTPFIQALARNKQKGLASIDSTLRELKLGQTLDQVFTDWVLANAIQSPYAGDGRYNYQSYKLAIKPASDVLEVDATQRIDLKNYGAKYFVLPDAGDYTLTFRGARSGKIGPPDAASGDLMWWGYNESRGAARLEREFDLTGVTAASLNYKLWYDIAVDDDVAEVFVSTDDGKTWKVMSGKFTKRCNWSRACYEGKSQGWQDERLELKGYAGKKIRIRFEYLTQAGDLRSGFFIDDIRLDAINFSDDAETADGGWQAQGFLRVPANLPWHWAVNVIDRTDPLKIQPMTLDERNGGSLSVTVGKNGALVAVNGMAPFIFGSAAFSLTTRQ